MTESSSKRPSRLGLHTAADDRLVYILPEEAVRNSSGGDPDLRELCKTLWRGKATIAASTIVLTILSLLYAFLATEWYRADVQLAPVEKSDRPGLDGQLSGLAALAGVNIDSGQAVEAVATLKSRDFARAFIEDLNLLPVFFSDEWNPELERWHGDDPEEWPDVRDAVQYFHEELLRVDEDPQTRLVTLSVEWTDPQLAAEWADVLVERINARLRERTLREAGANLDFLQGELATTHVVALQQSIGRLLENEMQKLMLARGNEEFVFRVIDSATVPNERVRPQTVIISVAGISGGCILGILWVLGAHAVRTEESSD